MKPRFEPIDAGSDASFACRRFSLRTGWPFEWHFHPEAELTLIVRGSGRRFVGDHIEEFTAGDLVLLGPNLPHTWQSRQPVRNPPHVSVVAQFLPDCFGDGFFDGRETRAIGRLLARAGHGLRFTGRAAKAAAARMEGMADLPPLRRMTALLEVLDALAQAPGAVRLSTRAMAPPPRQDRRRIDRVLRLVTERFADPDLSAIDVAAVAGLTESAFSRFFSRSVGKPFTRYVNELRVGRACELLAETERPIADVAMDCGFNNLSNFNRRFLQLRRLRPREYRSQFRAGTAMS